MQALVDACGVNGLDWHPVFNSRVIPENLVDTGNVLRGRTGLHFSSSGHFGRVYSGDLSVLGGWGADTTAYVVGSYYHIDIWGATYT